ncbi:MAG: hypothetical protein KatS3mg038_0629 [Candidatus Kapaibacterium sp.]|nr:MAG: hypothetical protein KatS3mg038_0629 [Candidatus Kapabacteria bacterium]GIV56951.1 MAG: hypothetical protein KatS3mg040_1719 [Candidatus Kapabacteria bacterium]
MRPTIRTKRVYLPPEPEDGYRVLVDRLWPRGLRKVHLQVDLWLRDIAPSNELRKWFNHDPAKWEEFKRRYWRELAERHERIEQLLTIAATHRLTLLYSARDPDHNQAVALKEYLLRRSDR